jgi:hypothetical protein
MALVGAELQKTWSARSRWKLMFLWHTFYMGLICMVILCSAVQAGVGPAELGVNYVF